ncbi:MAG: hypothetical protein WA584_18120 [Pyrinomonadaceae bacterium]
MARKKRLSPNRLAQEKGYFANLKAIADYKSQRDEYKVDAIQPIEDEGDRLRTLEAQKIAEIADIRHLVAENDNKFEEKLDGAALQIAAQYGEDSPEYQSMGRTRKSERNSGRRPKNSGGNMPSG